jgi:chemotaxis protein CheC
MAKKNDTYLKLSEAELDALRECGNVGIGNAVTALSKMINKRIEIDIPVTKFVGLNKFSNELGGAEKIVSGIYLDITGDLDGQAIFVFPEKDAISLIDLIYGNKIGTTKSIGEMEESAIKEMANIVVGAYLNSIADMAGMKIFPSIPYTATDMAQSIIDLVLIKQAQYSDQILIVKEKINIEGQNIDGTFIMVFTQESLKKLLNSLHEKYGVL